MDNEVLRVVWFFLIAALWIGFFFLEGFGFNDWKSSQPPAPKAKQTRAKRTIKR